MQQFGRYTLVQRIAQGGMAEVWRAAMVGAMGFTKPLAIKRIRPESAKDPEFVRMLVDEARIASTLRHPNVVQVTDLGEIDGQYFIAMEYVSGRHLGQVLAASLHHRTVLPKAFALYVVREALQGLHHAHTKVDSKGRPLNIVHRDVSPQNIMVAFDGSVRVADFGIAKAYGRRTMTEAGVLKGKYAYMAPEQARSEPVDARSDNYAMGVVLWEALANRRMYPAALDAMDVLKRVAGGEHPRLLDVVPDLQPELVALVDRALAVNPADRFQTAEEFALAAGQALGRLAPAYGTLPVSAFMRDLFGDAVREEEQKLAELDSLARRFSSVMIPAFPASGAGTTPPGAPAPVALPDAPHADTALVPPTVAQRPAPSAPLSAQAPVSTPSSGVQPPVTAPPPPPPQQPSSKMPMVVLGLGATALVGALAFRNLGHGNATPPTMAQPLAHAGTDSTPTQDPRRPDDPATGGGRPGADRPVRKTPGRNERPTADPPRTGGATPDKTPDKQPDNPAAGTTPPPGGALPPSSTTVLVVDSVPAGAAITVDGQPKGTAPVTLTVEEGVTVRVGGALAGWQAQERRVTTSGKRSVVLMDLADD